MLDTRHTVETKADADAYLSRLEAYAGQLDGETERLKSAGAQGVIGKPFDPVALPDRVLELLEPFGTAASAD